MRNKCYHSQCCSHTFLVNKSDVHLSYVKFRDNSKAQSRQCKNVYNYSPKDECVNIMFCDSINIVQTIV